MYGVRIEKPGPPGGQQQRAASYWILGETKFQNVLWVNKLKELCPKIEEKPLPHDLAN